MDPEIKMLQRSTELAQRRNKHATFDLEDDEPGELTHLGQSLSLDGPEIQDDFDEEDLSDAEDHPSDVEQESRKRRRGSEEGSEEEQEDEADLPERKKSKQEVMKEVVAKSKLYKYERQAAKDEDEDLREELDKDFKDIHALLRGLGPKAPKESSTTVAGMNPDRAALLNGTDKVKFDKDYDLALKKMAQEKRSIPSERTKTEEELVEHNAEKLRRAQRRVQGLPENSDDEDAVNNSPAEDDADDDFGFGSGIKAQQPTELGVEDEDEFLIDDELVSNGSRADLSDAVLSEDELGNETDEGDDAGFFKELEEENRPSFLTGANGPIPEPRISDNNGVKGELAHNFRCPESHEEVIEFTKDVAILDLPTVVSTEISS